MQDAVGRLRVIRKSLGDQAGLPLLERLNLLKEDERLDPERVMKDLKAAGKEAYYLPDAQSIAAQVAEIAKPRDVVIVMSNGGFGGIHDMLREDLSKKG